MNELIIHIDMIVCISIRILLWHANVPQTQCIHSQRGATFIWKDERIAYTYRHDCVYKYSQITRTGLTLNMPQKFYNSLTHTNAWLPTAHHSRMAHTVFLGISET